MISKKKKRKDKTKVVKHPKKWEIRVEEDPHFLARIIINGDWDGNQSNTRRLLNDICKKWPKDKKVKFLITCAGFIQFEPPENLPKVDDNKKPNNKFVELVQKEAEKQCRLILDDKLRGKLNKHIDFVTLGVDDSKDMVQLVCLVDLKNNKYRWTGKSYPHTSEENRRVLISKLSTHFFGKTMILDCHDLSVFSQRGRATTKHKQRKDIRNKFYKEVKKRKPTIVLHHAHTTDSSGTWTDKWNKLCRTTPVEKYASAFRYLDGKDGKPRSLLDRVRAKTKKGDTIDFIVKIGQ